MLRPVATQQSPLSSSAQSRRRRPKEGPPEAQLRTAQVVPGRPQTTLIQQPLTSPRRLRLIGGGEIPSPKVWRLQMMQTSEVAMRLPGTAGAWRMFSAARTLLALVGLAVVLALALPAPREILLLQFAVWGGGWGGEGGRGRARTVPPPR